jgi:hypothetical protein
MSIGAFADLDLDRRPPDTIDFHGAGFSSVSDIVAPQSSKSGIAEWPAVIS